MKLLTIITLLSLIIATSLSSYGQSDVTSKLNDVQKRLPMSRIQVDQLDRYYDSNFLGRRVQRLERINMQMQGRIMFLENLVADISMGGINSNTGFNSGPMWTCSVDRRYMGTHQSKIGATAIARDNCSKDTTINRNCGSFLRCEKH